MDDRSESAGGTFDDAARRMFAALAAGQEQRHEDVETVGRALQAQLRRFRLSESDAQDQAQDILLKILERGRAAAEVRNPAAFLTTLTRNHAVDALRLRWRQDVALPPDLADATNDDRVAALFDASATASDVYRALDAASNAGDWLLVRVIHTWLDAAEITGAEPSRRDVARRSGVSHTSVNHAVKRFETYLSFPRGGPQSS